MMDASHQGLSFVATIILFGILQAGILLYLFLSKPPKANRLLAVAITALLLLELESLLKETGWILHVIHYLNVPTATILLIGPCIYLYTRSALSDAKSEWTDWIHAVPFLFYFGYSFFFIFQSAAMKTYAYLAWYRPELATDPVRPAFPTDPLGIQGIFVVEGFVLHALIYGILGLFTIYKSHQLSRPGLSRRRWLLSINWFLVASAIFLFFSQGGVVNGHVFFKSPLPHYFSSIFSALLVYVFTLLLITNSDLLVGPKPKYQKSILPRALRKRGMTKVRILLEHEKPFLRQTFSLGELALATGLKAHHLSQILNEEFKLSFSELTNKYRIAEAKERLRRSPDLKIEALAYTLGYKSKSAFFAAFKRSTKLTPGQYRDQYK